MLLIAALSLMLADFRHLISLSDVQISGDGNRVDYIDGVPDLARNRYRDYLRRHDRRRRIANDDPPGARGWARRAGRRTARAL
jgi:hypothetical protein